MLTNRQIEVIKLLCFSNFEIARRLRITPNTVKNYVGDIFNRLGTDNRQCAQIKAVKLGIVKLDEIITEG